MLIRGDKLNAAQRREVLAAYVHRHHAIGEGKAYGSEQAWLDDHAFHFVKSGKRLAAHVRHAVPAWMADTQ